MGSQAKPNPPPGYQLYRTLPSYKGRVRVSVKPEADRKALRQDGNIIRMGAVLGSHKAARMIICVYVVFRNMSTTWVRCLHSPPAHLMTITCDYKHVHTGEPQLRLSNSPA